MDESVQAGILYRFSPKGQRPESKGEGERLVSRMKLIAVLNTVLLSDPRELLKSFLFPDGTGFRTSC